MIKFLKRLKRDTRGVTAIEYVLIATLISTASLVAMSVMGDSVSSSFDESADALDDAMSGRDGKE